MTLKRWIRRGLLTLAVMFVLVLLLLVAAKLYISSVQFEMITLESAAGQALLQGHEGADYLPLSQNWVAQQRMYCFHASAVIVMNSLQPGGSYTQDNLFNPETAHIISQDEVYERKFTLRKLADVIHTRSGLRTDYYHAGSGELEHGYAEFLQHLKENQENPDNRMIINYSVSYVLLGGRWGLTGSGHGSPVAAYNEDNNMVLMLEVEADRRDPFWISAADIYGAMNTVDPVSDKHRGWLIAAR